MQLKALTSLRIFAAMQVVFVHLAGPAVLPMTHDWAAHRGPFLLTLLARFVDRAAVAFFGTGALSVSFFFVLSGFILSYTYLAQANPRVGAKRFWLARLARIYPIYVVAWVLAAPSGWHHAIKLRPFGPPNISVCLCGISSLLLLQSWIPGATWIWNGPGWSLSTEAFFYLVFPLLGPWIAGKVNTPRRAIAAITTLWVVCLIPPLIYLAIAPDHIPTGNLFLATVQLDRETQSIYWQDLIYNLPLLRLPEFLIGIIVGKMFVDRSGFGAVARPPTFPLFAALFILMFFTAWLPTPLTGCGLFAPLFALIILSLAQGGVLAKFLSAPYLVLLGEASYSVYILHFPISSWVLHAGQRISPRTFAAQAPNGALHPPSMGFLLALIALILVVSIAAFKFVEVPMRSLIRALADRKGQEPSGLDREITAAHAM